MKPGRIVNMLLVVALLSAASMNAADKALPYEQSYTIVIKGVIAGSEKVSETTDEAGNIISSSEHEIFVTDRLETKRMAFNAKMQLAKLTLAPVLYTCRYTTGEAGDFYEVSVKDGQIRRTLLRNGHKSEIMAPFLPNTVILDFNVYHQYDYVIRLYDQTKMGRQLFSNFVPLIGNDIPLALTSLGKSEFKSGNISIPVTNYKIEFIGVAQGTAAVDKNNRLVQLLIPSQDLEVLRKDLLPGNGDN